MTYLKSKKAQNNANMTEKWEWYIFPLSVAVTENEC